MTAPTLLEIVGPWKRGNRLWTPDAGWRPSHGQDVLYHEQLEQWDHWRLATLAADLERRRAELRGGPFDGFDWRCAIESILGPAEVAFAATATTHKAYETIASILTTELNSLTNTSYCSLGAAQGADGTGGPLAGEFEFVTGGAQSATNSLIGTLWVLRSADGTNYEETVSSTNPGPEAMAGSFYGASGSTTKRSILPDRPLPPGLWKAIYQNSSGSTHAASSNTCKVRAHSLANA